MTRPAAAATDDTGRELTPRAIVAELDRYIVGQAEAKRAVAIAMRNRWRRQQLGPDMREEVLPKNIIMIGPTGVGKTEIARRLASFVRAPFIKVEASKYTEVGYVGRDVESMVRDLVEGAINLVRLERRDEVREEAAHRAEERLVEALAGPEPRPDPRETPEAREERLERRRRNRERMRELLRAGSLDDKHVDVTVDARSQPMVEIFSPGGIEHMGFDFQSLFERLAPQKRAERHLTVPEARRALEDEEAERLLDKDAVREEAMRRVQESGVIFIDEIDKIAGREGQHVGPDVSREGVQRDLLPIVEGTTVATRHGSVKTDHILFIAAGAFHVSKPSDLIPELQGRFPIRVELKALGRGDYRRILTEPKNALTRQYVALLRTEDVSVEFTDDAVDEIANVCASVNEATLDIGARRLHTIFEKLLEEALFNAPEWKGRSISVDREYVRGRLARLVEDEDLTRYVL